MPTPFNPKRPQTWDACLSCSQAARILRRRPATVRQMAQNGELPVVPHSGSTRLIISGFALAEWLRGSK